MARGGDGAVTIEFASGSYPVRETEIFSTEDSGAVGAPRVYTAAPGAEATLTAEVPVTGWRSVRPGDAAWAGLDPDARAAVVVAPLPATGEVPRALFDAAAEAADPAARAVRRLPNTNAVSSLVPVAGADSELCKYLGQFPTEAGCRVAALAADGLWAYAWHDPVKIDGDFARGCYGRRDVHGSRAFAPQDGVMSAVFPGSTKWREVASEPPPQPKAHLPPPF